MDKYESLGIVGEGSYGVVMKCRHKESGQIVAIKKFMEGDEDAQVKKIAMREVRMLKRLRHENLVNLLEVFRRKRRLCLVFEFVESTALDLLEARTSGGLESEAVRSYTFQLLRALEFCHAQNIIHRDIKPENVLISSLGVLKLCDFGFARPLAGPGENCTDYVATRWYRAPELLVGDTRYGREVDVWATGCLFAEMLTGDPLFPGDSDIDQLYQIIQMTGPLSKAHLDLLSHNPAMSGLRLNPAVRPRFAVKFPAWPQLQVLFLQDCLEMDPIQRPTCKDLLQHEYFTHDNFPQRHAPEIKRKIQQEFSSNPLGRKFGGLVIGKKRKGSKLTPNKENQEYHEAKKEKEVKDALKSSPYRQSQARISVGRLVGPQRQEMGRPPAEGPSTDPPPPTATSAGYPAIDGAPPPSLPAHGWVRDTLMAWGMAGLSSDSLSALLPRSDRSKPLVPVASTKSPSVLRRAKEFSPGTSCTTCQEVTARGHMTADKGSPRQTAMERGLMQRRSTENRARHGVLLPNVPGAVSKPTSRAAAKPSFTGSLTHVTTLDLLRTPESSPSPTPPNLPQV